MQADRKRKGFWIALFIALACSLAIPFLLVREPPLLDYPNHLARTFILAHLQDPAFRFSEFYRADWKPYPYILWDVLLVGLQQVLRCESAGKLLLVLTTVLLPVAVAWFLWFANRAELKLALLACVFSYYTLFLWGFTAYQLGVTFCFFMVGTWLWYRQRPSAIRAAVFVAISFATYFAHLLGFASAALILVLYELTSFKWRDWLLLCLFLLPPSLLALWSRPGLSGSSAVVMRPFLSKLRALRDVPTMGYDTTLDRIFLAGIVLCFLLAVVGNSELKVNRRWLLVAVGFCAAYLLLPDRWGETVDLDVRLIPPLCLLSLAILKLGRRATWIALLAVPLLALRLFNISTGFQDVTQKSAVMNQGIEHIGNGMRIFPLVDTCKDDDPLEDYYIHYWAYAVVRRGAVSPYLFDVPGQTPMRIIYDPYTPQGYWDHCYESPPDWQQVAADYDVIWSYGDNRYGEGISHIADKVFEASPLIVYRVRR
jgi:hypothetical protein